MPLVLFDLCKVLFSGFLQFQGSFVDGQKKHLEYRDEAPLITRDFYDSIFLFSF